MQYRGYFATVILDEEREVIRCVVVIADRHECFERDSYRETKRKFHEMVDEFEELKAIWQRAREIPAPAPKETAPEAEEIIRAKLSMQDLEEGWLTINQARHLSGLDKLQFAIQEEEEGRQKILSWIEFVASAIGATASGYLLGLALWKCGAWLLQ